MKKILIITRDFPPYSGRGNVMRILKFAKYLPEFGWQPFIIAEKKNNVEDTSLLEQLSSIVKTKYVFIETPQMKKSHYKELIKNKKYSALKRINFFLYRSIVYNLYSFYQYHLMAPDLAYFWAKKSLSIAQDWHEEEQFDLYLTSGPPFSTFKIGIELNEILNIPWVVDFRDAWVGNPIFKQFKLSLINWQNRSLEKKVMKKAGLIIFTTEPMQNEYSRKYSNQKYKMATITNGFDSADYKNLVVSDKEKNKLHFVYSGTISNKQVPTPFLLGLLRASEIQSEIKNHIKISFIGKFNYKEKNILHKLASIVNVEGTLPHRKALEHMNRADVFLLLINPTGGNTMMTGKIFEYLAFKKPIFAVSIPCAATDLIKQNNAGYIADWHNEDEIANEIMRIYEDWNVNKLDRIMNDEILIKFERKNLAESLSGHLNQILNV
jgi:hypothetical protein